MKKLLLLLITLTTFTNVSYASFPVRENMQTEIPTIKESSQIPWYNSPKNAIYFLLTFFIGLSMTTGVMPELWASDRESPWLLIIGLSLIGISLIGISFYFAKKAWNDNSLSKNIMKIIFLLLTVIITVGLFLSVVFRNGVM